MSDSIESARTTTTATTVSTREAVARLYHNWITGLILSLVHRAGTPVAADFVFQLFRDQHLKRFLPGLEKLGLTNEPDAIACARYHYLSNQIGGVRVEYLAESDRKAWVRYPPPRWIWDGTAICAVPTEVNLQMMRGWHAHNGVSLGNPNLGFVCTGMTTDGDPGLEGYYYEYDHPLSESERLRFAPDEQCPPIDPAGLPSLDSDSWPVERQSKAYLNYAMEYLRNGLPLLEKLLGAGEAIRIGQLCAKQTGMHSADLLARACGEPQPTAQQLPMLIQTVLNCDGSKTRLNDNVVQMQDWRLFDIHTVSDCSLAQVTACLDGIVATHDRFSQVDVSRIDVIRSGDRTNSGTGSIDWRLTRRQS